MNSTNLSHRFSAHFYLDFSIMLFLSVSFYLFSCLSWTPKKTVFLLRMTDANQVVESSYDFSVVDSNSLLFLFKHAPEVAKELHISSELSFETAKLSHRETWMVWNFVDDVMSNLWLEVLTYACFCFLSVSLYFMSCRLFYFICFLQFVDSFIHHPLYILVCHWAQVDTLCTYVLVSIHFCFS